MDQKTGNDYFLRFNTMKTAGRPIHNFMDLRNIPLRAPNLKNPTTLDTVVSVKKFVTPTEVDHYQIQRMIDVYVSPAGEDLGKVATTDRETDRSKIAGGIHVDIRGMVHAMRDLSRVLRSGCHSPWCSSI